MSELEDEQLSRRPERVVIAGQRGKTNHIPSIAGSGYLRNMKYGKPAASAAAKVQCCSTGRRARSGLKEIREAHWSSFGRLRLPQRDPSNGKNPESRRLITLREVHVWNRGPIAVSNLRIVRRHDFHAALIECILDVLM